MTEPIPGYGMIDVEIYLPVGDLGHPHRQTF